MEIPGLFFIPSPSLLCRIVECVRTRVQVAAEVRSSIRVSRKWQLCRQLIIRSDINFTPQIDTTSSSSFFRGTLSVWLENLFEIMTCEDKLLRAFIFLLFVCSHSTKHLVAAGRASTTLWTIRSAHNFSQQQLKLANISTEMHKVVA